MSAPWEIGAARLMVWKRLDYSDPSTFPAIGECALWCDSACGMGVGFMDRAHDVILCLDPFASEEVQDLSLEGGVAIYFGDPVAWMPLPNPPVKILWDGAEAEVTARVADIFDEIEPILRNAIARRLSDAP